MNRKKPEAIGIVVILGLAMIGIIGWVLPISDIHKTDPNSFNECFFENQTCGEFHLIPDFDSNQNNTLCSQSATHNCSPMTVSTTGGFGKVLTGDRIFVVVVSTQGFTPTITDTAGDIYGNVNAFLNTATTKIFYTGVAVTTVPTTVTATFNGINGQKYGMMIISIAYSGPSIGSTSSKSVTGGTTLTIPSFTTQKLDSIVMTGVSVLTGSCHDPITSTGSPSNPSLLNTLNIGCTNGNNEWNMGVQFIQTNAGIPAGTTYSETYNWNNTGNGYAWAFEIESGTVSHSVQMYYDSELQTSSTVISGTNTVIRSQIQECCALGGSLVEVEGYVSTGVGSLSQSLTFQFTNGGTPICSALIIQTLTALDTFSFSMRCVSLSNGQIDSLTYSATNTDGATTIFVNSLRLYILS